MRRWWQQALLQLQRRRLRDPAYAYLFAPPPAQEWVSIDCETTSLDPGSAEILSIAAVRISGNCISLSERLELLVQPEGAITPASIPIHGLRAQDVAAGLPVREALARLLAFIGSRPLVGYYLEFDLAVIDRQLRPWLGIGLPNPRIDVSGLYYDRMVTAYHPDVDLSLDAILHTLQLPDLPRHDPLNDAILAALIFLKLHSQIPEPL
ncbi:3'-5' exonuclease [Chitinilyticum piscinae]|uniref:3'-5' exonuclease n=1 Tax=Chitinilyticum piscinae TaxID=2866724 RepID=A0A8J7KF81_9NEIS|nr:3'-5' exonuclease [Chitinilyticum piscinae]MBE9609939.1 3'-5' exonuclease [Chitinilyticum piscinae]